MQNMKIFLFLLVLTISTRLQANENQQPQWKQPRKALMFFFKLRDELRNHPDEAKSLIELSNRNCISCFSVGFFFFNFFFQFKFNFRFFSIRLKRLWSVCKCNCLADWPY